MEENLKLDESWTDPAGDARSNLRSRISDLRCRIRPISNFVQGIVFKASFNTGMLCTGGGVRSGIDLIYAYTSASACDG